MSQISIPRPRFEVGEQVIRNNKKYVIFDIKYSILCNCVEYRIYDCVSFCFYTAMENELTSFEEPIHEPTQDYGNEV